MRLYRIIVQHFKNLAFRDDVINRRHPSIYAYFSIESIGNLPCIFLADRQTNGLFLPPAMDVYIRRLSTDIGELAVDVHALVDNLSCLFHLRNGTSSAILDLKIRIQGIRDGNCQAPVLRDFVDGFDFRISFGGIACLPLPKQHQRRHANADDKLYEHAVVLDGLYPHALIVAGKLGQGPAAVQNAQQILPHGFGNNSLSIKLYRDYSVCCSLVHFCPIRANTMICIQSY